MLDLIEANARLETVPVAYATTRDLLVVTGADAASYLQGQLSQDVEGLAVGATARTLLLQPQGKVDGWLRIQRRGGDEFWLDTDPGHGSAAEARLNRFKLRVDVAIEVRAATMLAVRGPGATSIGDQATGDDLLVAFDATWGGVEGVDLMASNGELDLHVQADRLGLELAPPDLAEIVRVTQGLPAMGTELDDSTIPAAAGVVEPSVDFTKGCYVGQELVARVDSRGNNTPTRLHRLRLTDGTAPEVGSELLTADGQVAGTVTSVVALPDGEAIGLGYLKRTVTAPVTLAVTVGDRTARVEATPLR